LDAQVYTKAIADVAGKTGANTIVFSNNVDGKAIAPRLSARLKAGLVSGAVALPDISKGFVVKKNVFSGKAFANISLNTDVKIIALNPNAYQTIAGEGTAEVIVTDIAVDTPKVKVTAVNKVSGEVPLTEAEIVVSAGRGMKGPENWGMIEELAKVLHATTPVAVQLQMHIGVAHNEHRTNGAAAVLQLYILPLEFPELFNILPV
jgi:electron transfer flavoprotein alpha subunit